MKLSELFIKHKAYKPSSFGDFYEQIFETQTIDSIDSLFEIGVGEWGCLRSFNEFFPNIESIHGVDVEGHKIRTEGRIDVRYANQKKPETITDAIAELGLFIYDIVIDDGTHTQEDQQSSIGILHSHVNPGGLYIIEDLHTADNPDFCGLEIVKTRDMFTSSDPKSVIMESNFIDDNQKTILCSRIQETFYTKDDEGHEIGAYLLCQEDL